MATDIESALLASKETNDGLLMNTVGSPWNTIDFADPARS